MILMAKIWEFIQDKTLLHMILGQLKEKLCLLKLIINQIVQMGALFSEILKLELKMCVVLHCHVEVVHLKRAARL